MKNNKRNSLLTGAFAFALLFGCMFGLGLNKHARKANADSPAPVVIDGLSPDISTGKVYFISSDTGWIDSETLLEDYLAAPTAHLITSKNTLEININLTFETLVINQDIKVSCWYGPYVDVFEPWIIPSLTTNGHTVTFESDHENTIISIEELDGDESDIVKGDKVKYILPIDELPPAPVVIDGKSPDVDREKVYYQDSEWITMDDITLGGESAHLRVIEDRYILDFDYGVEFESVVFNADMIVELLYDPYEEVFEPWIIPSLTTNGHTITFTSNHPNTSINIIEFIGNFADIGKGTNVSEIMPMDGVTEYTVTYQCGEGTGSDYVVEHIEAGTNHALVSFATAGFTAPSGYQFFKWQVGTSQHNPGDEITVNGNTTVTALYELIPAETFTITYCSNSGDDATYVVENIAAGSEYILVDLQTTGFATPEGKRFYCWSISGLATAIEYQPGDSINVFENLTILAVWEDVETPVTPKPKKKGCGGSIAATSIILSTLALAGLGLAISKKNKD